MAEKIGLRADRLLLLRDRNGWTQMDAAYRCHCTQGNYNAIERGLRTNITLNTLAGLASGYDTSIEFLLGLSNDPAPRPKSALDELSDDEAELVLTYQECLPLMRKAIREAAQNILRIQQSQSHESLIVKKKVAPPQS
ncbi:MAG: helix-turn-helix domain-containing protein [Dehalococcoidia bacterium]|nr:helix-turn-helix domain-containing protein [Dehalococcoidia bacterium]